MGFIDRIAAMLSRMSLAHFVLVKLFFLGAVAAVYFEVVQLGDRPIWAEDASEKVNDQSQETKSGPPVEETADSEGRKSFLEGLLNLPPINKDSAKKEEFSRFFALAERKRQQIDERMESLKRREDYLKELESIVETKIAALEDERILFEQSLQREKKLSEDRLKSLIDFYQKMQPKKAAPVIEKLDKDLVVKLFDAMPQKQVTLILSLMNPDKSVELTEYYGRVRSGREYEMLKEMNRFLVEKFDQCKGMPVEQAH